MQDKQSEVSKRGYLSESNEKRTELVNKILLANAQLDRVEFNSGKILRAVALCRCSTEEESQKDALIQQVREAKDCITEQGWELVDMYVEAKSGTTTKGRKEYNRLFDDLGTDKFDIVVIKSQDRLMRNTKDWYIFIDKLIKNGKKLYMYLDRKFYSSQDALVTGIKAILAEEYSRDLSKKINNAHKGRQKDGKVFMVTNAIYGYKKEKGKPLVIDEEEAKMVHRAFELIASGYGSTAVSKILYNEGYRSRKGGMINPGVIRKIIKNTIFMGNVVQNKVHFDFDSKRNIINKEEDWILHEGVVPAIVTEELFTQANLAIKSRSRKSSGDYSASVNNGQFCLSSKIECGLCGCNFHRTSRALKEGRAIEWKCSTYIKAGRTDPAMKNDWVEKIKVNDESCGCNNIHLSEDKLFKQLEEFALKYYADVSKEYITNIITTAMKHVLADGDNEKQLSNLRSNIKKWEHQQDILMDKLLEGVIDNTDFVKKSTELKEKINTAQNDLLQLESQDERNNALKERIEQLKKKMNTIVVDKAKVASIIEYVNKIVVYPERLLLHIDTSKSLGINDALLSDIADSILELPVKCATGRHDIISKEENIIIEAMLANPKTTVRSIADANGWPISRANRRVASMKAKGWIYYTVPNGKGCWVVVNNIQN